MSGGDETLGFLQGVRQVLHILASIDGDELSMMGRLIPYGGGGDVPLDRLHALARDMSAEQFGDLMRLQAHPTGDDEAAVREHARVCEALCGELACSGKELQAFGPVLQLRELVELLTQLDLGQLMALYEALPATHNRQLDELLTHLQLFFCEMHDDQFRAVHAEAANCAAALVPHRLKAVLLLDDQYVVMYPPLVAVMRLPLSDALCLANVLRRLKPVQLKQLGQLRQFDATDVMRLYTALAHATAQSTAAIAMPFPLAPSLPLAPPPMSVAGRPRELLPPQQAAAVAAAAAATTAAVAAAPHAAVAAAAAAGAASSSSSSSSAAAATHGARNAAGTHALTIVEEPDEAVVYRRNVKQHPTLQVTLPAGVAAQYVVTVDLVRCDTNVEVTDKIESGGEDQGCKGGVVAFKKIKIAITSHQTSETLFALRFKLRHRETRKIEAVVQSRPFQIVSHTSQISGVKRTLNETVEIAVPAVQECIPPSGPAKGGTRIALLGGDFVGSPALTVRFGNTVVPASMRSTGTLLLHAPAHEQGAVEVRVSNDNSNWSATATTFVFEADAAPPAAPAAAEAAASRFEAIATSFADHQADLFASLPINLVRAMDDDEFDALFATIPDGTQT